MKKLIIFLALVLTAATAFADRGISVVPDSNRIALVIGNGNYQVSPLKNPVNDARDMADVLTQRGFAVELLTDATQRQMETGINRFGRKIRDGGIGLFFYAGHGMQVDGHNYLIPVDAVIETESDVKYEAVDAGKVLGKMDDAGSDVNIIILDACRNNPFARSFRSSQQGLAQMDAPSGSIISYATAPGSVAADGDARNGVYTRYLLENMKQDGLNINEIFMLTRRSVMEETNGRQVPWESSSLTGYFYLSPPKNDEQVKRIIVENHSSSEEMVFWQAIKNDGTIEAYRTYLSTYPNGKFAPLAKLRLTPQQSSSMRDSVDAGLIRNMKPGKNVVVRPARATWYSGYFQEALYSRGLTELGYTVKKPKELKNEDFYRKVAIGDVDFWANGWFPMHKSYGYGSEAIVAGTVSRFGAISGYLASKSAVERFGITSMNDFKKSDVKKAFDSNGDGKADLVGCPSGWSCEEKIKNHLRKLHLQDHINISSGPYEADIKKAIDRHRKGYPVLYYSWAPNWTLGELQPGEDVLWLNVPEPAGTDEFIVYGLYGATTNPINLGFQANDIKIVANGSFLDRNPCAKKFFETATLSLNDLSTQVLKIHNGKKSRSEIDDLVDEWIARNRQMWNDWLNIARLADAG